jgi:hypothetical protein
MRRLAAGVGTTRSGGGTSIAGILEGVLKGDVFVGELAVKIGSVGVCRGDWRWGGRGRGLLRWRSVVGVLEDSCRRLANRR